MDEQPPCASFGVVEIRGEKKGFLAIRTENPIGNAAMQNGFDLGTQLLGKDNFAVLHLILNFSPAHIYDVFVNLNTPVAKQVLGLWKKTGDYFFFVFADTSFMAFHQNIGQEWHDYDYFGWVEKVKNTETQYNQAVEILKSNNLHGEYLASVFQDDASFLNLEKNRFCVKGSHREGPP